MPVIEPAPTKPSPQRCLISEPERCSASFGGVPSSASSGTTKKVTIDQPALRMPAIRLATTLPSGDCASAASIRFSIEPDRQLHERPLGDQPAARARRPRSRRTVVVSRPSSARFAAAASATLQ